MRRILERVKRHQGDRCAGSYRDLLYLRLGFLGVRDGFDARAAFRMGFLAAAFAVFLAAGFLEALWALFDAAFGFADRFFVVEFFFFGVVFAFRAVRFLAALIAAPERAPITVPTTGKPSAVPATAPATAPPRVLPVEPGPVSVPVPVPESVSPLSLSSMSPSLSIERNNARFCTSRCQLAVCFMHCSGATTWPHLDDLPNHCSVLARTGPQNS